MKLRVVSYNALSSHLASPSHYSTLNPSHLEAAKRLPVVMAKLREEMSQDSSCVLCLQEVSYNWAGDLHTFFSNEGYHMVTGLYGRKFNGYMGVALAWPTAKFKTIKVDISRLSDERVGGWPPKEEKGIVSRIVDGAVSVVASPIRYFGFKGEETVDHWAKSEYRSNVLLTATLEEKSSGQRFCVGNYHMPCAFYAPMIMTIHSEMAARHVQDISKSHGSIPYLLAGDFNIKPQDSMYKLLTSGLLDKEDPCYPTPKNGMEWEPTIDAMRSAYAEAGGEPDFTNYARVEEKDPFIDTLDYIFMSKQWKVCSTKLLPSRQEAGGPFPNLDSGEPSDHVLIAATLEIS